MRSIKVLMLIEDLFDDKEALYPYYRMKEESYKVTTIGPVAGKEYQGKYGITLKADLSAKEVELNDVSALIIPGGYAPDKMRKNKDMVDVVRKIYQQGRVVAAICHGPWMLVEADAIKDKKVTGASSISTDLKNAGGSFVDCEVVISGNIITSRGPDDLPVFCKSIIGLISQKVQNN